MLARGKFIIFQEESYSVACKAVKFSSWGRISLSYKQLGVLIVGALAVSGLLFFFLGSTINLESTFLVAVLVVVFLSAIPFIIAYFASSGYVKTGLLQLLLLGCAMLTFGMFNAVVAWGVIFVNSPDWANFTVSIHNSGLAALALLTFCGSLVAFVSQPDFLKILGRRKSAVLFAYLTVGILTLLYALITLFGLTPAFVVSGEFTLLRQVVLVSTVCLLTASAVVFGVMYLESKSNLVYWYSLGLLSIAIGVVSILVEPSIGTPLSWTGRIAQFVGCIFLLNVVYARTSVGTAYGMAEAFRRDKYHINLLFSNMRDGFAYHRMILDDNGKPVDYVFLETNDAFEKLTGLTKEKIIGRKVTEVLPGIEKSSFDWIGTYGKVASTREPTRFESYSEQLQKWYAISAFSPAKDYFAVIFEDVSEAKKVEQELMKEKENLEARVHERTKEVTDERQRLYSILETLPAYVVLLDKDYRMPFANKVFRERFGDSLGRRCYEYLFNRDSSCEDCETYKALKTNMPHRWEWTGPDARVYDVYDFPFTAADGSFLILEMGIDITERKGAEKKIRDASLYSRSLIEASLDPLVTISAEGKITDVNEATVTVTGCSREELIGSNFSDYFTDPEKAQSGYKRVFTEGLVRDYPLAIRHKSGRIADVLYNAVVYRNEAGEIQGIFAAARDVTELKKVEEEAKESAKKLKDAERLATIGATAGMVGHDIRNPLQAIVGDVYLAKMDLDSLPESEAKKNLLESLSAVQENVQYINKIVADLQDFAKPLNPYIEEVDLKLIMDELLQKNSLPENIKREIRVSTDARMIMTDPAYIKRILSNLIANAIHAMPEGGNLKIRTYREGSDAFIMVEDTGVGIPEDIRDKVFTPLFTTKSKGQGFGLAVVKRLTESLEGNVTFESQVGKGTRFIIRLRQPV